MKLVLLLAAGALAAQDTTPPTISLDLGGIGYAQVDCQGASSEALPHKCSSSPKSQAALPHRSATCEVYSNCPLPTCVASDHHDATVECDVPQFMPIQIGNSPITDEQKAEFELDSQSRDGTAKAAALEAEMRKLRSMWTLTYGAKDDADNEAQKVVFTMIFQDTVAPQLYTEFADDTYGENGPTDAAHHHPEDTNGAKKAEHETLYDVYSPKMTFTAVSSAMSKNFAESCSQCGIDVVEPWGTNANGETSCTEACVYNLVSDAATLKSTDNYGSEDDTDNIRARISNPDGTETMAPSDGQPSTSAKFTIDTHQLGQWTITYTTHDNAGIFGYDEQNNDFTQVVQIHVTDNTDPEVYLTPYDSTPTGYNSLSGEHGSQDGRDKSLDIECNSAGSRYVEAGATCLDRRDHWVAASNTWESSAAAIAYAGDDAELADAGKVILATDAENTYTVTYTCTDESTNSASRERTVVVTDTTAPELTLLGATTIENSAGVHQHEDGHGSDGPSRFENLLGYFNPAEYGVGTTSTSIVTAAAGAEQTAGFGGDDTSAWKGATCSDTCDTSPTIIATLHEGGDCTGALVGDGKISNWSNEHEFSAHNTEFSVLYTCFDGTQNDARARLHASECRKIINVDHTRPIIQILGSDRMTLEATHESNYVDDGATCSDEVDGVISENVEVSGDVVNLSKVGTYTVTYNCKDAQGNTAPPLDRVVVVRQTSCPTCTMAHCGDNQNDCGTGASRDCACTMYHEASFPYVDAGASCSDAVDGVTRYDTNSNVDIERTGTYTVTYTTKNSVGLWNDGKTGTDRADKGSSDAACLTEDGHVGDQVYIRTVVIRDTLKPVLSVRYQIPGGERAQVSTQISGQYAWRGVAGSATPTAGEIAKTYGDKVAGDLRNPADLWAEDQEMAEQAPRTASVWVLASAAAAVAGLALLGVSQRRGVTVTSVPV